MTGQHRASAEFLLRNARKHKPVCRAFDFARKEVAAMLFFLQKTGK
jgi:hypothetical protein